LTDVEVGEKSAIGSQRVNIWRDCACASHVEITLNVTRPVGANIAPALEITL
jgi:hypothetical protein